MLSRLWITQAPKELTPVGLFFFNGLLTRAQESNKLSILLLVGDSDQKVYGKIQRNGGLQNLSNIDPGIRN